MELAYHGITPCPELQSAYQAYLDLLNPLLDQIEALRPPYPFAANPQGKPKLEVTSRGVSFYDNHIEIGCQNVSRWQVEQLALQLGWDFPA